MIELCSPVYWIVRILRSNERLIESLGTTLGRVMLVLDSLPQVMLQCQRCAGFET